jgi:UDP-2,3-diacylglucosamine pyrophosphatase LpxH
MEKKRIYIADIHMNAGWGETKSKNGPPYEYEWLGRKEANRFANFLEYLNDPRAVQEVIILGDLMDDWVYPVDVVPPSLEEIVDAPINKNIVGALKRLTENEEIRVIYMPGNHDMGVTEELVRDKFGEKMVFGGKTLHNSVYRTSRLRAEHGSAYSLFNAPPSQYGVDARMPLGYFISRVVATRARNTGKTKRHYWSFADDLLEMVGPQKLAACVFEAVLEEAGLENETQIKMRRRDITAKPKTKKDDDKEEDCVCIAAGEVKEKFANLYDLWEEHNGKGSGFRAVMAETGLLGRVADRLCTQSDTNIVVFGHSHDWKVDKDAWFVKNRIYANCGTWCDEKKSCTWVESRKDRGKNRHIVRVMDWNDGEPKPLKKADVPL